MRLRLAFAKSLTPGSGKLTSRIGRSLTAVHASTKVEQSKRPAIARQVGRELSEEVVKDLGTNDICIIFLCPAQDLGQAVKLPLRSLNRPICPEICRLKSKILGRQLKLQVRKMTC